MNTLTQLHADIEARVNAIRDGHPDWPCRMDIESQVADGMWAEVVWGNQDAIDRRLCGLGETRELTEWFMWREKSVDTV